MTDTPGTTPDDAAERLAAYRDEVSRLRLMLDVQSTIDLATGMLNAQGLLEPIQAAMDRLGRTGEGFGLCLVDLTGLGDSSDDERDAAMRHVGALASASLRGIDRVGRLGSTSLMLVLPQIDEDSVHVVLRRLADNLAVMPYDTSSGAIDLEPIFTVVLSPEHPIEPESMLDQLATARAEAGLGAPVIVRASAERPRP